MTTTTTEPGVRTVQLGPTKTYSRRRATWVPAAPGQYADNRTGTLTITCNVNPRRNRDSDSCDTYSVQPDSDAPPGYRAFLLENLSDPDDSGPLRCVVATGAEADRESCSCEAGRIAAARFIPPNCKHNAAFRMLLLEGIL